MTTRVRSVLITGAARRIGRRLALDLAEDGWDVAIHCNEAVAEAQTLAREIDAKGRQSAIVCGDLSQADVPTSPMARRARSSMSLIRGCGS